MGEFKTVMHLWFAKLSQILLTPPHVYVDEAMETRKKVLYRPFPSSCLCPLQKSKSKESLYKGKLIFITKTLQLDSLGRGGRHELGNGLLRPIEAFTS